MGILSIVCAKLSGVMTRDVYDELMNISWITLLGSLVIGQIAKNMKRKRFHIFKNGIVRYSYYEFTTPYYLTMGVTLSWGVVGLGTFGMLFLGWVWILVLMGIVVIVIFGRRLMYYFVEPSQKSSDAGKKEQRPKFDRPDEDWYDDDSYCDDNPNYGVKKKRR